MRVYNMHKIYKTSVTDHEQLCNTIVYVQKYFRIKIAAGHKCLQEMVMSKVRWREISHWSTYTGTFHNNKY